MTSKVEICNIALSNIRSQGINDIDESSIQAQNCKLKYDLVLNFLLRDTSWNFAKKQVALALLIDDLFSWTYAYQYPSDCIRINRLMSEANRVSDTEPGYVRRPDYYTNNLLDNHEMDIIRVPHQVLTSNGDTVIGCNEANAWVDYNQVITDPNRFDSQFIMAFSWYLAAELAVPIIGGELGKSYRREALGMYMRTVSAAQAMNANEAMDNSVQSESEFITAQR